MTAPPLLPMATGPDRRSAAPDRGARGTATATVDALAWQREMERLQREHWFAPRAQPHDFSAGSRGLPRAADGEPPARRDAGDATRPPNLASTSPATRRADAWGAPGGPGHAPGRHASRTPDALRAPHAPHAPYEPLTPHAARGPDGAPGSDPTPPPASVAPERRDVPTPAATAAVVVPTPRSGPPALGFGGSHADADGADGRDGHDVAPRAASRVDDALVRRPGPAAERPGGATPRDASAQVRVHVEVQGMRATVWLGLPAALADQRPALAWTAAQALRRDGRLLDRLICNGAPCPVRPPAGPPIELPPPPTPAT